MPFLSYGVTLSESIYNAGRFIKEAGANAVKLEGGIEFSETIKGMVNVGIPVMGHIGLRPQSVLKYGNKIAGKSVDETEQLVKDARAIESAGAFAIVLEGTTGEAAKTVTGSISIPTIGIGAGKYTDGQVLVIADMLGIDPNANFKHNKKYADLYSVIKTAVTNYCKDIKNGDFPTEEQTFHMK
jgi:3-methyl-2-oxobutanoate hydroxymethyltransferase